MATRTIFPVKPEHDCVLLPSGPILVRPKAPPNGVYRCNVCGRLYSVNWVAETIYDIDPDTGEHINVREGWKPDVRYITYEQALHQIGPEPWDWTVIGS